MIEKELRIRLVKELSARVDLIRLAPIEEPYFKALEKALGEMPDERKGAAIKEVRAHLWAMVEAKRSDGLSESDAWQAAMREFGRPEEVGRALWLQCLKSGRVEVQGEPLPKWKTAAKWLFLMVFSLICCGSIVNEAINPENTIAFAVAKNIVQVCWLLYFLRPNWLFAGKDWRLSFVSEGFPILLFLFSILTENLWRATPFAPIRDYFLILATLGWAVHSLLQWKRELDIRPWKSSAKYFSNPIAAEQSYRSWPPMLLFTLAPILFVASFCLSTQLLSLPFSLLPGLVPLCGALFLGKWLTR